MTEPPVSPGILTTAREAGRRTRPRAAWDDPMIVRDDVVTDALFVAAPLIRAGERQRLQACPTGCDPDCEQICHEVHDIPRKRDHDPEQCRARVIAAAVTAERERIAAVTRFEVIDETGRAFVRYDVRAELAYQDDDRTLKVFLRNERAAADPTGGES